MIVPETTKNYCMKLLTEARKKVGFSQKEASRIVSMTLSDYREFERLERPLSVSSLEHLCERFELSFEQLTKYGNPWNRLDFSHSDSAQKLKKVPFERLSAEAIADFSVVYDRHIKEINEAKEPRRIRK